MNTMHKMKWEKPSYFPLKDAMIKSGNAYFPGFEGAKCLVTPAFIGETAPTSIIPVTNTVFSYTNGPQDAALCGIINTINGPSLCEEFENSIPCSSTISVNFDITIQVCSSCF